MLTKDYYLKYKMRPSDSLIVHVRVAYHKYSYLTISHIFLTGKEMIYGLLMSMSDYWTLVIYGLVRDKNIKSFWDYDEMIFFNTDLRTNNKHEEQLTCRMPWFNNYRSQNKNSTENGISHS